MSRTHTPAIARKLTEEDCDAEVVSTTHSTVSHQRGLGDSGQKVQVVEHECPECGHEYMVREWRVNPELRDTVKYYCMYPNCSYFVGDEYSYAMKGQGMARTPLVTE